MSARFLLSLSHMRTGSRSGTKARATRAELSFARLVATAILLFAFTMQAYLTQTHMHNVFVDAKGALQVQDIVPGIGLSKKGNAPAKLPSGDQTCPVCHQMAQAGSFLTPAAAATLPVLFVISVIPLVDALLLSASPLSHAWQGRAPPSA